MDYILVEPSDNIFQELGNNTYDDVDLMSELIDNSLAARMDSPLEVTITIYVEERRPVIFEISDNAAGISKDNLPKAVSPAATVNKCGSSLNEHGMGMKAAVASIGTLQHLRTKTCDSASAYEITRFAYGQLQINNAEFDRNHGTTLRISVEKPVLKGAPQHYTNTVSKKLGARYRHYLSDPTKEFSLEIKLVEHLSGKCLQNWDIKPVSPVYFHPNKRSNEAVIFKQRLKNAGWEAHLTFGYAPHNENEWDELQLEQPDKRFHPYRLSQATQGLDIILNKRVIKFHQLPELGIVRERHNSFNRIRGELTLISGFPTATTKNDMASSENWEQLKSLVSEILNGKKPGPDGRLKDYIKAYYDPDEIPESLLQERLSVKLKEDPAFQKKDVACRVAVGSIDGFIDILADGEVWELKKEDAGSLEVYQLFMYMDAGNYAKGYLVAKKFTTGANEAKKLIQTKHGKEIVLYERRHLGLDHPASQDEREKHY